MGSGSDQSGQGGFLGPTAGGAAGAQGAQGSSGAQGAQGSQGSQPALGPAPPAVATASAAGVATTASSSDHTHAGVAQVVSPDSVVGVATAAAIATTTQNIVATWGTSGAFSQRYFAVDPGAGVDGPGRGFSDVSMAAAGANACRTLNFLFQILPKFGNGRVAYVGCKAGNYGSVGIALSGYTGYQLLLLYVTDTVASAGSVAFAMDANDRICAGHTTGTGLNAAGYEATAYSTAGGVVTITLQLAGGGAPAFGANPARPYGCRIRGDVSNPTAALRNNTSGVILTGADGATLTLSLPLAAVLGVGGDKFYLEMSGMTGPTETYVANTGEVSSVGFPSVALIGFQLGRLQATCSHFATVGCEGTVSLVVNSTWHALQRWPAFATLVGTSLRCTSYAVYGGIQFGSGVCSTDTANPNILQGCATPFWEAFSSGSTVLMYGCTGPTGNNIISTIGTNGAPAHGSPAQIWGTSPAVSGTLRCGLWADSVITAARINFTNMGGNPLIRAPGMGDLIISGPTSGSGNTDVGLDLTPNGVSNNTLGGTGRTIAVVSGFPSGAAGDVRLAGGQLVTWTALAATGMTDSAGNRFIGAGTSAPLAVVGKFSGAIVTSAVAVSTSYLADSGSALAVANLATPQQYPTSQRLMTRIRVKVVAKSAAFTNSVTATLYKTVSNVTTATTMQVTIPNTAVVGDGFVDTTHPVLFADGDSFDVRLDDGGTEAAAGTLSVSATLEGPV